MSASIHKAVFQFNWKVRSFQPAASETVWQSNSKILSLFGEFRYQATWLLGGGGGGGTGEVNIFMSLSVSWGGPLSLITLKLKYNIS